jgi:hypothetical protein
MIGTAHHFQIWESGIPAGLGQRIHYKRGALGWGIRIYLCSSYTHVAAERNYLGFGFDLFDN